MNLSVKELYTNEVNTTTSPSLLVDIIVKLRAKVLETSKDLSLCRAELSNVYNGTPTFFRKVYQLSFYKKRLKLTV